MGQTCNCPLAFNITIGIFLIFVPIASWLSLWGMQLPLWLELLMMVLGIATIFLNTLNRVNEKVENLSTRKANKIHAEEGY